jgi:hypothetical protein
MKTGRSPIRGAQANRPVTGLKEQKCPDRQRIGKPAHGKETYAAYRTFRALESAKHLQASGLRRQKTSHPRGKMTK